MLKQRIVTALVLLPLVLILIFKVQLELFAGILLIIVYLMALEWGKLSNLNTPLHHTLFALAVCCINAGLWHFGESLVVWPSISWPHSVYFDFPLLFLIGSLVSIFLAITIVVSYSRNSDWWQTRLFRTMIGLVLLPSFFVSFISVRNVGYAESNYYYGGSLILFMLLIIWAADTGAFITGKLFGKHKLTKVSPNKTWEGVVGGLLLSMSVGWAGIEVLKLEVNNLALYLLVIFMLVVISVFGDLFESALKRAVNLKDSGHLLPGHGGLLDRLDSTITVAPVFYLTFSYFEWFNA